MRFQAVKKPQSFPLYQYLSSLDVIYGPRMETLLISHGAETPYADFWMIFDDDDRAAGVICRFYGTIYLSVKEHLQNRASALEIKDFLSRCKGWYGIEAQAPLLDHLAAVYGVAPELSFGMVHNNQKIPFSPADIYSSQNLREVYHILLKCHPEFAATASFSVWSSDYRERLAAGRMEIFCIRFDGKPVTCASINAYNRTHAILGSVSTLPAYRGHGLGSTICAYCVNRIIEADKTAVLQCGSEELVRFYEALGFSVLTKCGSIDLP